MRPLPVTPSNGPWPLFDAAASRAAETAALAGSAPGTLMQAAGRSVARLAAALAPHAGRIVVLAGPGNNGGDGAVAATELHRSGRPVQVHRFPGTGTAPADAASAWQRASAAGVPIVDGSLPERADLVVDALLGLGTHRAPVGELARAIAAANTLGAPVLAVDLPSGLHPDTGMPLGDAVVCATATLSLLTLKPGLFTGRGRDLAGTVWFDDLGVAASGATAVLAGAAAQRVRRHSQHKGSFGDVAVVGGAPGMAGALRLAAHAALAAGAGRVYASALDDDAPLLDDVRPEVMGRRHWWRQPAPVLAACTVVCGCGGGVVVREALPALLSNAGRLVLDADALNAIAGDPMLQTLLSARAGRGQPTVLTPHPLEAARLLGVATADVQADRLAAAARLAARFGATVVLKGSGTVVASPGSPPSINPTGNALLASAGTGDVLAGWLGGLWAQGLEAHGAATEAVWRHGEAADAAWAAGRRSAVRAADLVDAMRA